MDSAQRLTLLRTGDPQPGEAWADLGCGDGAFALPLAERLGSEGSLLAVDRDGDAIDKVRAAFVAAARRPMARAEFRVQGLARLKDLPPLDGALFANVLHYFPGPASILRAVRKVLRPGGRILVIEYDRSDPNTWVPHPIPVASLPELAAAAGVPDFEVKARVPSDFGRVLYAAVSRLDSDAS